MGKVTGASATISGIPGSPTMAVQSIGSLREFVEILDDTSLASSYKEAVADDLKNIDPLEIALYFDGTGLPTYGTPGTLVLTFPLYGSQTTAAKVEGTGFVSEFTFPELAVSQRTVANTTLQFDGKTDPAYSTGS